MRILLGGRMGTYNTVRRPVPMAEVLQVCIDVTAAGAARTWVEEDFLAGREVLPAWHAARG